MGANTRKDGGYCILGATRWSIRTRDLTSSERSSKEANGAGPMRFWRRLLDDTLVVAVTPGTDMVSGFYWIGWYDHLQVRYNRNRVKQHQAILWWRVD